MSRIFSDDVIQSIMHATRLAAPASTPPPPTTTKQPSVVIGTIINVHYHPPKDE